MSGELLLITQGLVRQTETRPVNLNLLDRRRLMARESDSISHRIENITCLDIRQNTLISIINYGSWNSKSINLRQKYLYSLYISCMIYTLIYDIKLWYYIMILSLPLQSTVLNNTYVTALALFFFFCGWLVLLSIFVLCVYNFLGFSVPDYVQAYACRLFIIVSLFFSKEQVGPIVATKDKI